MLRSVAKKGGWKMRVALFGTFLYVLFPACNDEESKPPGPVSPAEGEREGGEGEGEGGGLVTGEGEGEDTACDPAACTDEFECTEDRCVDNACVNVPTHARCGEGKICRPAEGGCVAPPPCRDDADCVTDDPCQTGTCDPATRACAFAPFDGDEDGHAPIVCGGDDCDDSKRSVHPEANESCNDADDNCDGQVDEGFDFTTTEHCGNCDNHCPETTVCQDSQCVCREGEELCGGGCVSLASPEHCGRCGNECPLGANCENGECVCPNGTADCGFHEGCIDIMENRWACGRCNNQCPEEATCINGECHCPEGLTYCNDQCTNISNDDRNCGACNNACADEAVTPLGRRDRVWCVDGACRCHAEAPNFCNDCEGRCVENVCYNPTGFVACNDQCVDLASNAEHCGECENACDENAICTDGQCVACLGEAMRCNDEIGGFGSYCACGTCDTICSDEFEVCADDACICAPDANRCELDGEEYCTDVNSDAWNCGRCGNECPDDRICRDGRCVPVN